MAELTAYLSGSPDQRFGATPLSSAFREEIAKGKMFGVLVVERKAEGCNGQAELGYLAGYSGQICGRSDWEDFVPAVFDYLQPDGYFKQEEARIVALGHQIAALPTPRPWTESADDDPRPTFIKGRQADETDEAYIRRRQFENAELHRWKLKQRAERDRFEATERQKADKIASLKTLRRQKSDSLQTWLFRHFVMTNGRGEQRDLTAIFSPGAPPGGAGECCEPRLLQYAFAHGLRPVSMAMFWWGESPKEEVRHHLQCYPACNAKCRPILTWMLQGIDVEPNALHLPATHCLQILYEDADICVVSKPAGMLSVPGKGSGESVLDVVRRRHPSATGPRVVHRLDMSTSGLMVVANTMEAYLHLQAQFARREVKKRYIAILSHPLTQKTGIISLPLRPDLDDRPRQVVDPVHGKPAITRYEQIDGPRVALYPLTGRTHQLRMHCAHRDGLNNPILGDRLYGHPADRLYLHADRLTFRHPTTGRELTFTSPAPF